MSGLVSAALEPSLVRTAGRDPGAFESFYRATVDDVIGFFARRVIDPHVVADLTADVYVAALGSAHTYVAARGSPRAWLFGIARHVLAGHRWAGLSERDRQRPLRYLHVFDQDRERLSRPRHRHQVTGLRAARADEGDVLADKR